MCALAGQRRTPGLLLCHASVLFPCERLSHLACSYANSQAALSGLLLWCRAQWPQGFQVHDGGLISPHCVCGGGDSRSLKACCQSLWILQLHLDLTLNPASAPREKIQGAKYVTGFLSEGGRLPSGGHLDSLQLCLGTGDSQEH